MPDDHHLVAETEGKLNRKIQEYLDERPNQDWSRMKSFPHRMKPRREKEYSLNEHNPLWHILNQGGGKITPGRQKLVKTMLDNGHRIYTEEPKPTNLPIYPVGWFPDPNLVRNIPYVCPECGGNRLYRTYEGYYECPDCNIHSPFFTAGE